MIAKLTTLATSYQSGGLPYNLAASTAYLFNTKRIKDLKDYGTDSEFVYVFTPEDRRTSWATIRVDEAKADINTKQNLDAADGSLAKVTVDLKVYEDDDTASTPVAHSFLKDDLVLGEAYTTSISRMTFSVGGFEERSVLVNHTLDAIVTLAEATS
jgi:hypothetical protein